MRLDDLGMKKEKEKNERPVLCEFMPNAIISKP